MVEPLCTFREYLKKVLSDPKRTEEMKILVDVFGIHYLELVLEGKATFNPGQLIKSNKDTSVCD